MGKKRAPIKDTINTINKNFFSLFSRISRTQEQTQAALFTTLRSNFCTIIDNIEKLSLRYSLLLGGEIIYRQEGPNLIATTFFPNATTSVTQKDIDEFLIELDTNQQILAHTIDSLKQEPNIPPYTKKMFLNRCTEMQQNLELLALTVYTEAEKGGWQSDPQTREARIEQAQKKIWDVFGPSVSSNKEESRQCLDKMAGYYKKNSTRLTEEEQQYFEKFLTSVGQQYNRTYNNTGTVIDEEEKPDKAEGTNTKSYLYTPVIRDTQKALYTLFQKYQFNDPSNQWVRHGIKPRSIKLDPNTKNVFTDGATETIYLPDDGAANPLLTLLITYQHENTHASAGYNANAFFGKGWKGAGYLGIEEGLAKLSEAIVKGKVKTLRDIPSITEKPGIGMVATFVCEHYAFDDAVKIMTIYEKLTRKEKTKKTKSPEEVAKDMVIRRKRFVPYDRPGASTKDCLYTRGLRYVAEMFAECKTIKQAYQLLHTLNFAKLGPQDIPHTDVIKKELGIKDTMIFHNTFLPRRIVTDIQDMEGTKKYPSRRETIRDRILKKLGLRPKTFDDMHAATKKPRLWRPKYHPVTTDVIDIITSSKKQEDSSSPTQ